MNNCTQPIECDTICFGGEDWWYHNRGHFDMQIMRWLARLGTTLYINSIVMQKPKLTEGKKFINKLNRKAKSIFTGLKKSDAGFWVYSPFSLPMHHIAFFKKLNEKILNSQIKFVIHKLGIREPIIWVACPAACDVALKAKRVKLVYQRTDRYEEFPNVDRRTISEFDIRLKKNADLTVFVSRDLYSQEHHQCKKAIYLDHGVDYELFASAEKDPKQPHDIIDIHRPIIGFYGGFAAHTTDIGLLKEVVDLLPDRSFVFVGQPSQECDGLTARKNVWMLGQKPYEQIPHYGKCFDVTIMPWKQNRWIQACNPIKLKEYLALGKPIVSTPFNELSRYSDVVYEAKTPKAFAQAIEKALAEDCPSRIVARRKRIINASWDSKAQVVLDRLFTNNCKADTINERSK